jgi:hypothetical protein
MHYPVSDVTSSTAVPVTILLTNGLTTTVTINEQANGGTWVNVGLFLFDPTAGQYVQLSNAGTTGTVVADAFSWTYVSSSGVPTTTPLPLSTPIPGYLAKLPFNYPILDAPIATYWNQTTSPTQLALVGSGSNPGAALASVTSNTLVWCDASWADAQPQLSGLVSLSHIQGFLYDAEHWSQTPLAEQNNLASTVLAASQTVHGLGLQFWVTTDPGFAATTIEPIAENADVLVMPGAYLEASPSAYQAFVVPLIAEARAANPRVKIYGRVDFINGTPQQDLAALEAIERQIDGIDVYVTDSDLASNLPTLQALIAQN